MAGAGGDEINFNHAAIERTGWKLALATLAFAALLHTGSAAAEDGSVPLCIPAGAETATTALIADPGFAVRIGDGAGAMAFDKISIEENSATFTLSRVSSATAAEVTAGAALARIVLLPVSEAVDGDGVTEHFAIRREMLDEGPAVLAAVDKAIASIRAHDSGDYFQPCSTTPYKHRDSGDDSGGGGSRKFPTAIAAIALLLAAGLANYLSGRRRNQAASEEDKEN